MVTDCEISIETDEGKVTYSDANCNFYQKVFLLMARGERQHMQQLEEKKAREIAELKAKRVSPEEIHTASQNAQVELIKQLGVLEWFVKQIPVYNAVKYVNHLFGEGVPEAATVKHSTVTHA